ncbi:O-antigen ligase family protein [Roseateles cavernae]|uniref:O-antigen ligase family protein n=1 Tax=Roseateles cavernae TaxID=3153578 RepID=UPI0032E4D879
MTGSSMLGRPRRQGLSPRPFKKRAQDTLAIGALLFAAAFAGLLCVFLPWVFVVALCMAIVYPLLVWNFPWLGIGAYALVVLVAPDVKWADVATFGTLAVLGLKALGSSGRFLPPKAILNSYLVFVGLVALSGVLALTWFHNQVPFLYRDGRAFLYWLWLPLLYWLVNKEADGMRKLSGLILFIGGAVCLIALLQWSTGIQIVASGRVGALDTAGGSQAEQTRVQMHGFVFVLFCFVWAFVSLVHGRRPWLLIPALFLLLGALYVNFGRALWFWTACAVLLSIFWVGQRRAVYMLTILLFSGVIGVSALALFKPAVLDAVVTRFVSVRDEGGSRTSLGWRKLENEDAMRRIARSPLVGVGLGGEYRRWISEIRLFEDHTRYVHNSYVFVALKVGVPALAALLALLALSWQRGRKAIAASDERHKPLRIAAVAVLPAMLGLCITQPEMVTAYSALFFCCLLAVLASGARADTVPADGVAPRFRRRVI